jgi:hypothetical protein
MRDQYAALLPLMKQVFGPEHPDMLATRVALGNRILIHSLAQSGASSKNNRDSSIEGSPTAVPIFPIRAIEPLAWVLLQACCPSCYWAT